MPGPVCHGAGHPCKKFRALTAGKTNPAAPAPTAETLLHVNRKKRDPQHITAKKMADTGAEQAAGAASTALQDAATDNSSSGDYTQDGAVAREIAAVMVSATRF